MHFRSSRYVPIFPDVVNISKLAIYHLSCIMFKERHPPDTVPCFNTGLRRKQAQQVETG